jgi:hypothetical protein
MRLGFILPLLLLTAPGMVRADPPKAPASRPGPKKPPTPITGETINVDGKRQVPIVLVVPRDNTVKTEMNSAVDQHVMDSANGGH